MKDNKPYIVIAQTHQKDLDEIASRRSQRYRNHVVFVSQPEEALSEVMLNPVDIVITGQYFYENDFVPGKPFLNVVYSKDVNSILKRYVAPCFGPYTGTRLSEQISSVKPEVLVLRYSSEPGEIGDIAGEIEKSYGLDALVRFIDSEKLCKIFERKDWENIRTAFPEIRFYRNFFNNKKPDLFSEINSIAREIMCEMVNYQSLK